MRRLRASQAAMPSRSGDRNVQHDTLITRQRAPPSARGSGQHSAGTAGLPAPRTLMSRDNLAGAYRGYRATGKVSEVVALYESAFGGLVRCSARIAAYGRGGGESSGRQAGACR